MGDHVFRVPVHTAADDGGQTYGLWASGSDYKVSFHDGMAFYPVLGPDAPRNLPVRWQTTEVRTGDGALALDLVATHATDWRVEYRRQGFVEAYDVRDDGVEQTFELARRPQGHGDIVVRGRFVSELSAAPTDATVQDLVLRDGKGAAVVRYGRALAIDADGSTAAVTTAFDGDRVELRLAADRVTDLRFPLVIDPLLSNAIVGTGGGAALSTAIARDSDNGHQMVTMERQVSASDTDVFALLTFDTWSFATTVFNDIATWDSRSIDTAHVGGANRWVVPFVRDFGFSSQVRCHYHPEASFALNNVVHSLTDDDYATEIAVGGARSGTEALIVYRHDVASTNDADSSIRAIAVDARQVVKILEFEVNSSPRWTDGARPAIAESRANASEPWDVAYEELDNDTTGDDWNVFVTRVHANGLVESPVELGNPSNLTHNYGAQIDADEGICRVAFLASPNGGRIAGPNGPEIWTQSVDWTGAAPAVGPLKLVRSGVGLRVGGLAYDSATDSHWTIASSERLAQRLAYYDRMGYDAEVVESGTINSSGAEFPSITYDVDANQYALAFANGSTVLGVRLAYPSTSGPLFRGHDCGPARISVAGTFHENQPWAGSNNFRILLSNPPQNPAAVLLIGVGGADIDLSPMGLTGCGLFLDPARILAHVPAPAGGSVGLTVPLPSSTRGLGGYAQWVYATPGANPAGLSTTRSLVFQVR